MMNKDLEIINLVKQNLKLSELYWEEMVKTDNLDFENNSSLYNLSQQINKNDMLIKIIQLIKENN